MITSSGKPKIFILTVEYRTFKLNIVEFTPSEYYVMNQILARVCEQRSEYQVIQI